MEMIRDGMETTIISGSQESLREIPRYVFKESQGDLGMRLVKKLSAPGNDLTRT